MVATYEMNDSGVEWIGQMPKGWEIISFKYTHNGANVGIAIDKEFWSLNESDTVFYTAGLKPINTCYNSIDSRFLTKENDLLLARNGTPYVYSPQEKAIYTDHIIRVSIKSGCNKTFIKYCLQQSITNEVVDTVSIATWSVSIWNRQYLPLPPLPEQTAIASYLDDKCSAIDDVIAQAKETIEEYKSWKASVIFEAVTKGLDPNVEMKDSGVEWIGQFPKEWTQRRLKSLLKVLRGGSPRPIEEYLTDAPDGINWIKIGDTIKGEKCIYSTKQKIKPSGCAKSRMVHRGDLLLTNSMSFGEPYFLEVDGCIHDGWVCLTQLKGIDKLFLYYFLRSNFCMTQFQLQVDGGVVQNLNIDKIGDTFVYLPPSPIQAAIASYLDDKCSAIDSIISEKLVLLDELESYKKSLIFETVTGKRRVC